ASQLAAVLDTLANVRGDLRAVELPQFVAEGYLVGGQGYFHTQLPLCLVRTIRTYPRVVPLCRVDHTFSATCATTPHRTGDGADPMPESERSPAVRAALTGANWYLDALVHAREVRGVIR